MPDDLYVPLSSTYYDYETPPIALERFTSTDALGRGALTAPFPIARPQAGHCQLWGVTKHPQQLALRP
jgi:hypothetical protein